MDNLRKYIYIIRRKLFYGVKNKLFLVISVAGFFLIATLGGIISVIAGNFVQGAALKALDNQTQQTVNVFDNYIQLMMNTALTVEQQPDVQSIIRQDYTTYGSYLVYRNAYSVLKSIHEFEKYLHVYLFVKDMGYVMSSRSDNVTSDYTKYNADDREWYKDVVASTKSMHLIHNFLPPVTASEEEFAFALTVRDIYTWDIDGIIVAALSKNFLYMILEQTQFEEQDLLIITGSDGNVAFSSNGEYKDGGDYHIVSVTSKQTGWQFTAYNNKEKMRQQLNMLWIITAAAVVAAVGFLLLAAKVIAERWTLPIHGLIEFIGKVEAAEFAERIQVRAKDEIGELIHSFDDMVVSVRENQFLRKKAEIDALQKQIDPHFLFNTLQSIKALLQEQNTAKANEMIEKLADIFRYNTNREGTSTAKLSSELQHIKNYIDIQKVRFGSRIHVEYDIDERLLECRTLKFILQPIVENSIRHSMEHMAEGYRLRLSAQVGGGGILLTVLDNGVGIPPDKLRELNSFIHGEDIENADFGIGLRNIAERLRLTYGGSFGLTIDSKENEYTRVEVRIPFE